MARKIRPRMEKTVDYYRLGLEVADRYMRWDDPPDAVKRAAITLLEFCREQHRESVAAPARNAARAKARYVRANWCDPDA